MSLIFLISEIVSINLKLIDTMFLNQVSILLFFFEQLAPIIPILFTKQYKMLQNNQTENNDPPQPEDKNQKKRTKPFSLKPQNFENRNGLQKLYELTNQINWDDQMTTQSSMNLVAMSFKTWHYQMVPKYSYDYFIQRCQALGSNKILTAYMNKVRRIHKGVDHWKEEQKQVEGGQKEDNNLMGINFQQQLQLAQRLGEEEGAQKMKEVVQMKVNNKMEQIDELMQEDLKMFQEMNRKRERKEDKVEEEQQGGVELEGEDLGYEFDDDYY